MVVCLTNVLALRQGSANSRIRLCYEICSVVLGTVWIVQYAVCSVEFESLVWVVLVPLLPVPYWIMVWHQAIYLRLGRDSGCLALFFALLIAWCFFGVAVEIPVVFASAMRTPYNHIFLSLITLLLYTPMWISLAARLYGILHRPAATELGSDDVTAQPPDHRRARDASENKNE